nr:MAG TPA: hypothetical protein [Caudoviricetes sp.]
MQRFYIALVRFSIANLKVVFKTAKFFEDFLKAIFKFYD